MGLISVPPPLPPRNEKEAEAFKWYFENKPITVKRVEIGSFGGFFLGWLLGSADK